MSTYIFGHTNPDSDSIIGAISLAYLKNQLGEDCVATKQGEISAETKFILDKFGKDLPKDTIEFLNSLKETKTKTVTEIIKEKVTETVVDAETGEEKTVTKKEDTKSTVKSVVKKSPVKKKVETKSAKKDRF